MNSPITATEARRRFFEIIDWAVTTEGELVVEKDGKPAIVISGAKPVKSKKEIREIVANFKRVMSKYPRETLTFDTKEWRDRDRKYLANISKGRLRGE